VKERLENEDLSVLAYRFDGDRFCTEQRFNAYATALGKHFCPRVLPARAANPNPPPFFEKVIGCPHSVVTAHLIDSDGEPTLKARDEIICFFNHYLRGSKI
jgi:hypothetical protein